MTDVLTPSQRHKCMSHILSKNTKPEILVRKFLFSHGYRYRIHVQQFPGKPDIVLPKYKTVIFINGCFWHGHENCHYFRLPKSNTLFWKEKIESNKKRDDFNRQQIVSTGWNVMQIWECQLKPATISNTLKSIDYTLNKIYLSEHSVNPVLYSNDTCEENQKVAEQEIQYIRST